jgi:EmrB/QacA subfamily drug resistance transporter
MAATSRDQPAAIQLSRPAGRWVLLATVLGSSMAMLDATVVNVALPTIGRYFGASLGGLQWTVTAYTLTLAGLILLGGALGDRLGRRRVFVVGVGWFAVASALCGLAPGTGVLIAARALQGVGGALLTPGSLAIIQASFHPDDRPRAVGAWSGLGGVAGAVGPLLGGWLVQTAGWRWVFLLNLPLAVVVLAVTVRHVPETRDATATGGFDISGAALAALALGGVTYALIQAPEAATDLTGIIVAGVVGVAAGAAFVIIERRRTRHPDPVPAMLPLDVFASRQFTAVNIVTFLIYGALGGVLFLLVLQVQVVSGYSPLKAGTALLPLTLVMLAFSARSGALAQKVGPRWPMTIGTGICAVGLLLMTRIGAHASYVSDVLPAVLVFSAGLVLVVAPLTATVLASADVRHAGVASGVNNAVARAASLCAVAGIPAAVGLGAASYHSGTLFNSGFDKAVIACAGLLVIAAVLCATMIDSDVLKTPEGQLAAPAEGVTSCAIGGPPPNVAGRPVPVPAAASDPGPRS